jgi:DNA-binding NtrC family response regulator
MPPDPAVLVIIDDDDNIRDFLEDTLSFQGYRVVTASTVQEAEDLRQHLGLRHFGLVICDVHLTDDPGIHEGYGLYQGWIKACPALPFIFLSGDLAAKDLPAVRAGQVLFLAKPFAVGELLRTVKTVFSG